MNDIGTRISILRKNKNMTQETLANMLGISPQAVSKWETGTTMPDIMLLPIIADALETDLNSLFGTDSAKRSKKLTQENIHEEMYNNFFEILQCFWGEENKDKAKENRDYIKNHSNTQTLVLSNSEGNGVYADVDIALAFHKDKNDIIKLFDNDNAWLVLKRFAVGETRSVFKFILTNENKSFTSSLIAQKCELDINAVERALENLLQMNLIGRKDIETGDGIIYVYHSWGTHKKILIYSMLSIADRLGRYQESYRGFMG